MAHAGNFSSRGQTDIRKLRLSLPNSRKIFNLFKVPEGLERSLFSLRSRRRKGEGVGDREEGKKGRGQTTKGRSACYY